MNDLQVSYRWTKEELITSTQQHHNSQLRPSIVIAVSLLAVLVSVLSIFILVVGKTKLESLVVAVFFNTLTVWWLFFRRQVNTWMWTRGFEKNPAANSFVEWKISDEEVTQKCQGVDKFSADFTSDWKIFTQIIETKTGFLLYTSKTVFHWLPYSGFQIQRVLSNSKPSLTRRIFHTLRGSLKTYHSFRLHFANQLLQRRGVL